MRTKTKITVMLATAALALAVGVVASAQNLNVKGQVVGEGQTGLPHYFLGNVGIGTTSPGTARLAVIDGNVGIGTTAPVSPLHVSSSTDNIMRLQTADNTWLYTSWHDAAGTRRAWMGLDGTLTGFNIQPENGTDRILLAPSGGNVGIGTTAPQAKLQVATVLKVFDNNVSAVDTNYIRGTGTHMVLNANGSLYLNYPENNAGQTRIGENLFVNRGTLSGVGIGAESPAYSLDVIGNMRTVGRYYSNEWIEFDNYTGLFSPINAAHLYPNSGSYGAWRIAGSRGDWFGLEFDTAAGPTTLMMGHTSQYWGTQQFGVHNNAGGGWLWRFDHRTLVAGAAYFDGELGAGSLRRRSCYWAESGKSETFDHQYHETYCASGYYQAGWRVYASDRLDGRIAAYCCLP